MTDSLLTERVLAASRALLPGVSDAELVDRTARAVWSCIVEPGDGIAGRLVAALGASEALRAIESGGGPPAGCEITHHVWADALGRWTPRLDPATARVALDGARIAGASLLVPEDDGWPAGLTDLGDHAPLALWVRGDIQVLSRRAGVAIVGARAASGYGEHVAMDLAGSLAVRGVTVVSGAAYGIDGAAHRAALAVGAPTVAILAGGVDRPYPTGHTDLIRRIALSGAVISEVPCGSAPTKWRFLHRNRLIAALAQATVVVEAGARSGSLNTASHAASLGRPLGAVPGPVTSATSAGCHRLLREYDARCVTAADEVLELLGWSDAPTAGSGERRSGEETRVRDALSRRTSRTSHDLAQRTGMSVSEVEAALGLLALAGSADRREDGWRST